MPSNRRVNVEPGAGASGCKRIRPALLPPPTTRGSMFDVETSVFTTASAIAPGTVACGTAAGSIMTSRVVALVKVVGSATSLA